MNQMTLVGNEVSVAKQLEEFAGNHQIFLGGNAYGGLSQKEQAFCKKQPERDDFNWQINNKRYPFYRYAAHWDGYEL